jgi:hypothetical protein
VAKKKKSAREKGDRGVVPGFSLSDITAKMKGCIAK